MSTETGPFITKSQLIADLRALGLQPGDTVMLHAAVNAIGWVVGGPDVVLQALLELLTPAGTLMMYVGWEDAPSALEDWPPERRAAYLAECPPFDPDRSRANRTMGILTEYLRTWPGARRSAHPEASAAAVGAQAAFLTADHPLTYGYGPDSPLAKLTELGGKVLLLGSPLERITLLHYAEDRCRAPNKRIARYRMPVLRDGRRAWIEIEEFDTGDGIVDWDGPVAYFELIARAFLDSGQGQTGQVGAARSFLFDAPALVDFAVTWLEEMFGHEEG